MKKIACDVLKCPKCQECLANGKQQKKQNVLIVLKNVLTLLVYVFFIYRKQNAVKQHIFMVEDFSA